MIWWWCLIRPSVVLHLSFSAWINISGNCRPFLLSQFFVIVIFSFCGMVYDLKTMFASNLKFLVHCICPLSQLNVGCFIMDSTILGPIFCIPSCLVLFCLWSQPWPPMLLLLQPLPVLLLQWYLSVDLPSSVFVFSLLLYSVDAYVCQFETFIYNTM